MIIKTIKLLTKIKIAILMIKIKLKKQSTKMKNSLFLMKMH
jgi:hypothetical protein